MVEKRAFSLVSIKILIIDEVDFIFGSSKQVNSLCKILNSYTAASSLQQLPRTPSLAHRYLSITVLCMAAYNINGPRAMWYMFMSTLYCPCPHTYITHICTGHVLGLLPLQHLPPSPSPASPAHPAAT